MSAIVLDLGKKVELNLLKVGFTTIPTAAVRMAIDKSGSMGTLYRNGFVQTAVELFMGVASKFDDNGELEISFFNDEADSMSSVGVNDYKSLSIPSPNYGTNYKPVLEELWGNSSVQAVEKAKSFFGNLFGSNKETTVASTKPMPTFIGHITDGDPNDFNDFTKFLEKNQDTNTFVQFIVLGNSVNGKVIDAMKKYKNTQVYVINDPRTMNADELYEALATTHLLDWFNSL